MFSYSFLFLDIIEADFFLIYTSKHFKIEVLCYSVVFY
jgi:hypothetical protein